MAPHDMVNVVDKARGAARRPGSTTTRSWSASAAPRSATTISSATCAAWRSCARPAARWCSTRPIRVQLPGGQGTSSGGQREFVPVLARAAVATRRLRAVHGNPSGPGECQVRRAQCLAARPDGKPAHDAGRARPAGEGSAVRGSVALGRLGPAHAPIFAAQLPHHHADGSRRCRGRRRPPRRPPRTASTRARSPAK